MPKFTVHPDLTPDYLDNGKRPSKKEPDPAAMPTEHARTHHRLKPLRAKDETPPPAAPDTSNPYDSQPAPKKKKPPSEWG